MLTITGIRKDVRLADKKVLTILELDYLHLEAGEQAVIFGASGSGKSTLLNLIAGLAQPTAGDIIYNGENITLQPERKRDLWRAANIGYIFQKFNLLEHLTVYENIFLVAFLAKMQDKQQIGKKIRSLLKEIGLEEKADLKPALLSIGEQQRVAVVRAIINEPKLILADEPTASLDRENTTQVISMLRDYAAMSKAALLISSHDTAVIEMFALRFPIIRPRGGAH